MKLVATPRSIKWVATGAGSKIVAPGYVFNQDWWPRKDFLFVRDLFLFDEAEGNYLSGGLIEIPEMSRIDPLVVGQVWKTGTYAARLGGVAAGSFLLYGSLNGKVLGDTRIMPYDCPMAEVDRDWVLAKLEQGYGKPGDGPAASS